MFFSKRRQEHSKSEKQARKERMGEEEQRILKQRNKTNSNEKEFKYSDMSFMHDHTLHDTLHRIYVFLSEIGM